MMIKWKKGPEGEMENGRVIPYICSVLWFPASTIGMKRETGENPVQFPLL